MLGRPVAERTLLFGERRRPIGLVILLQIVRRPVDVERRGPGESRQEKRIGVRPRIAHGQFVDDLDLGGHALDHHFAWRAGGRKLLVIGDIFPVIAEVLRRERVTVRPAVALAQLESEDAPFLYREAFEDVGHKIVVLVIADKARIAVNGEQLHVLVAVDQHAPLAAVVANAAPGGGNIGDQRRLGQPLRNWRQGSGFDQRVENRCLDIGNRARRLQSQQQGDADSQQEEGARMPHPAETHTHRDAYRPLAAAAPTQGPCQSQFAIRILAQTR